MNQPAPIALFVYNRPEHTRRTLQALEKNLLAIDSLLYIFSDGAKSLAAQAAVDAVRKVIREEWHFKQVQLIEREQNFGLAKNVIDGVSMLMKAYGRAVVLEDDVLFSKYTLSYFNEALDRYAQEERVMHIAGFMYELDRSKLEQTFFTRYVASQAWATWGRAWDCLETDIDRLIAQFDQQRIQNFTFDNSMNFWRQILQQRDQKIDSWAVRWYASVFLQNGLALSPNQSLIDNIGHDGSGIHSDVSAIYAVTVFDQPITVFPSEIKESEDGYRALKHYFKHRKGSLWSRGIRFVRNKILRTKI